MVEDIYDFSGVSLDDLSAAPRRTSTSKAISDNNSMPPGSQSQQYNSDCFLLLNGGRMISNEDDEEEWYPPTPPPYDVTEKLLEANERLESDPFSSTHVPDKLQWRPDSRLVEIRWLYKKQTSEEDDNDEDETSSLSSVLDAEPPSQLQGVEKVVIIEDLANLRLIEAEIHPMPRERNNSPIPDNKPSLFRSDSSENSVSLASTKTRNGIGESESPVGKEKQPESVVVDLQKLNDVPKGNNKSSSSISSSDEEEKVKRKADLSKKEENNPSGAAGRKSPGSSNVNNTSTTTTTTNVVKTGGHKSSKLRSSNGNLSCNKKPGSGVSKNSANKPKDKKGASYKVRSNSIEKIDCSYTGLNSFSDNNKIKTNNINNSAKKTQVSRVTQKSTTSNKRKPIISNSNSLPNLAEQGNSSSRSSSLSPAPILLTPITIEPDKKTISFVTSRPRPSSLSAPPLLQRKISRNSLSSNSSLSSHSTATEDSDSSRRAQKEASDQAFVQWKQRKKEEKRLKERRAYLQMQIRRRL